MWWTVFTLADLYIGLIVLDAMKLSVPPNKVNRLQTARKVILGLMAICVVVLLVQVARRHGCLRR